VALQAPIGAARVAYFAHRILANAGTAIPQSYTALMNQYLRLAVIGLACAFAPVCFGQWMWIDKDGRKVFSDQVPPPDVPANKILKRPGNRPADAEPAAAAPAQAAAPAGNTLKLTGKDKELEEKKKQAQAAEAEKKKAQEEDYAKALAENCERAKRSKATLDSGVRLTQVNAKGEREFLDDAQRAAEGKRLDGVIARDCKVAQ